MNIDPFRAIKRIMPRSLFARALIIFVTPIILAQAVATYIFYERHWNTITNRLAYAVAGEIAFVIAEIDRNPSSDAIGDTLFTAERTTDLAMSFEPDAKLEPPKRVGFGLLRQMLGKALEEKVHRPYKIDRRRATFDRVAIHVQLDNGVLTVLSPERRLFTPTTYIFLLWMLGSSVVLSGIAILFLRNQIRPILRLADAADNFGKGRDVSGFKPEGAIEVRRAGSALLVMRDRLRRQSTQRTSMLSGVSHDLRTPLTRMKLQLAMLPDSPEITELKTDVDEMETMIEAYLAFARGEEAEAACKTDIELILNEVVASARRAGANVDLSIEQSLAVSLRPNAFKRCMSNLIGNAARYGKKIEITTRINERGSGKAIEIMVDDDGPGIPDNRREEVFRPFVRLDDSRNPETGGVGLGLTIARDIARSHGGDLVLGESASGGLRATVRLPV